LKAGGLMVYSVCSITREEGPEVVAKFLADHPEFQAVEPFGAWADFTMRDGAFIRTLPHLHGTDGFFIACLKRRSS
jgi:16S rRNA (cytosine967-C5)-methyltransferase